MMRLVTVYFPQRYIDMLDQCVKRGEVPNRNQAIREAVRDLLKGSGVWEKVEVSQELFREIEKAIMERERSRYK